MIQSLLLTSVLILVIYVQLHILPLHQPAYTQKYEQSSEYIVVSGATGGVGVQLLKKLGKNVIILHRDTRYLQEGYLHLQIDYSNLQQFDMQFLAFLSANHITKQQITQFYSIHGCGNFDRFDQMTYGQIKSLLDVNLLSHVILVSYFVKQCPNLRKIGLVSSLSALFPAQYFQCYSGCKAFLESFALGLGQEYRNKHRNCIIEDQQCERKSSLPQNKFDIMKSVFAGEKEEKQGVQESKENVSCLSNQLNILIARPPAIRNTRFTQQKEVQKMGGVGQFVNLKIFSVDSSAVAQLLLQQKSGVFSIGWLTYACEAFKDLFGNNVFIWLVKQQHMQITE